LSGISAAQNYGKPIVANVAAKYQLWNNMWLGVRAQRHLVAGQFAAGQHPVVLDARRHIPLGRSWTG
jgi:hypothetical protein